MNWYMASWEMLCLNSFLSLPDICSGDHLSFRCLTTNSRISFVFNLSFLPLSLRFNRARSLARRGVYLLCSCGKFLLNSLDIDEGERPSIFAMYLTDFFCQNSS